MSKFVESVNERLQKWKGAICRAYIYRPCLCFCGNWLTLLLIIGIVGAGGAFAFVDLSPSDFVVLNEQDVQNSFALQGAQDLLNSDVVFDVRSQPIFGFAPNFIYEVKSGEKLFTAENVQTICLVEGLLLNRSDFRTICNVPSPEFANGNSSVCGFIGLVLSEAFYENRDYNCTLLTQEQVDVQAAKLSQGFVDNVENPTIAKSTIFIAGPLGDDSPPFKNFTEVAPDFDDEQVTEGYLPVIDAFIEDLFDLVGVRNKLLTPAFDTEFFSVPESNLQIRIGSILLDTTHFLEIILVDQAIATGSYLVVMIILTIYLRSIFLSLFAMLAVLSSMATGLLLFVFVLQIDYFTPLNILVLFLISGIGADNVLVLSDAWAQSEKEVKIQLAREKRDNKSDGKLELSAKDFLVKRLEYSYGRAALSVSQTASTTFIAFLATAVSPIDVIAGLGLYASLVIASNLFFMFTIHPANLIMHHTLFRTKNKRGAVVIDESVLEENKEAKIENEVFKKESFLDKAFNGYLVLVNKTVFPKATVLLLLVFAVVMLSGTTRLETPSELESNFPEGHMFSDFNSDFNKKFTDGTDDSFTLVSGVFGIKNLNLDGVGRFSGQAIIGTPNFDENFDLTTLENQDFVIEICEELSTLECDDDACTQPSLVRPGTISCFLPAFRAFVEGRGFSSSAVDPENGGISDNEEFVSLLQLFLNTTQEGPDFANQIGIVEGELKFVVLEYRMTMIQDQPLAVKEPVLKLFDDYTQVVREKAPLGLDTFYQSSFDHVFQHTERAFVSGLFQGMAISLTASFFVLFFGTRSLVVSFLAILGVGSVVVSVLGTVQLLGFELGTAESIAGVFVIGLAVDYIVHLGHMFMHSKDFLDHKFEEEGKRGGVAKKTIDYLQGQSDGRVFQNEEMINFAVRKMGGTVLAGAVTTFFSALFLSLCTFVFFQKMSTLLMFTIFYSVVFAFFYFVPALRIFGPGERKPPKSRSILTL